jgi:hypothetical protein
MPVAITVTPNVPALTVAVQVTGLTINSVYSIAREIISDDPSAVRKLEAVAHRSPWTATATSHTFTDYEPPVGKAYRYRIWLYSQSPLLSPPPAPVASLADSANVTLTSSGMVLRSLVTLGKFARIAMISPYEDVEYPLRYTEIPIIGAAFPVVAYDRRSGRRSTMSFYAKDDTEHANLKNILGLDTHQVEPLWLRAPDDSSMLWDDLYFLPLKVSLRSHRKTTPAMQRFAVEYIEIDPKVGYPQRPGDA